MNTTSEARGTRYGLGCCFVEDMRNVDQAHGFMIDSNLVTSAVPRYCASLMIGRSYMASFGGHDRDGARTHVNTP